MAAVPVAVGSAAISTATGFTCTLAAVGGGIYHPEADDLLIAVGSSQSTVTAVSDAAAAPWVNVMGDGAEFNHSASACGLAAFRYRVTATDETNDEDTYSLTMFTANETGAVQVVAYRGADWTSGNPIDNWGTAENAAVTPHTVAGITGTGGLLAADSAVVTFVSKDNTGAYSSGAPAGWTQLATFNTNVGRFCGYRNTNTTANTNVASTTVTPSAADEAVSISIAVLSAAGGSVVNGTMTAALGGLTATATGVRTVAGASVAALGALSAAIAGTRAVSGSMTAPLGGLTATALGVRVTAGVSLAALGGLSATIQGTRAVLGTATAALGGLTAHMEGHVPAGEVEGTMTAALGGLTATAAGIRAVSGTATAALGGLSATVVGYRAVSGVSLAPLGALIATAVGVRAVLGTMVAALGGLQAHAQGPPPPVDFTLRAEARSSRPLVIRGRLVDSFVVKGARLRIVKGRDL